MNSYRPTIGFAFSGSGNKSTFYIGFLEALKEQHTPIDYIAACSGASLVAAAFVCGHLEELKVRMLNLDKESLAKLLIKNGEKGGLYSLDLVEKEMLEYTKGLTFEEIKPHMAFVAVDIETGEQVTLCMGDIARAACISCTVPAVFKPVKWGGKTLVDGGLLTQVPTDIVSSAGIDIIIGVNMRGAKHIFSDNQIKMKRVLNFFKKMLFIEEIESLFEWLFKDDEEYDPTQNPNFFSVLGKSLDLAIKASMQKPRQEICDLMITPNLEKKMWGTSIDKRHMRYYYEMGKQVAEEYAPKIKQIIAEKEKLRSVETV